VSYNIVYSALVFIIFDCCSEKVVFVCLFVFVFFLLVFKNPKAYLFTLFFFYKQATLNQTMMLLVKRAPRLLLLLMLFSVGVVVAIAPPKPVISFDFQTEVTLTLLNRTAPTVSAVWYQDYANGVDLFDLSEPEYGYSRILLNYTENSVISYNSTNCDWGCYQDKCCNRTNNDNDNNRRTAFRSRLFADVFFKSAEIREYITSPPPPPPPSCSCAINPTYHLIWALYPNTTYNGTKRRIDCLSYHYRSH